MPLPTTEFKIGERTFYIRNMPANKGHLFLLHIEARLADTVGLLATSPLKALTTLLETDSDEALEHLLNQFLEYVAEDGRPVNADTHFSGEYQSLMAILGAIIDVNFGFLKRRKMYSGSKDMGREAPDALSALDDRKMTSILNQFSQSHMVLAVLRSELRLTNYHQLCHESTVEDLFCMYEVVKTDNDITKIGIEAARAAHAKANNQ